MERREDQRLRIGDLWPAGEHVGRPQWRLAFVKRPREKLQFRLNLRLGVPRNRDRAREPRPREDEETNGVDDIYRQRRGRGVPLPPREAWRGGGRGGGGFRAAHVNGAEKSPPPGSLRSPPSPPPLRSRGRD